MSKQTQSIHTTRSKKGGVSASLRTAKNNLIMALSMEPELDSRDRVLDALLDRDFKAAEHIMHEETVWWKKLAIAKDILDASIEDGNFAKTRKLFLDFQHTFKNYGQEGMHAINMLCKRLAMAFLRRDFLEDAQRIVMRMYRGPEKESLETIIYNIKREKIGLAIQ